MDVAPALPSAGTHVELCPALDEGVDADRGSAAEAFSNGGQDPWHNGGVTENQSESVLAIMIPNGART